MKNTDIQKIRKILIELKHCEEQHIIFNLGHKTITLAEINEALALLPCETCGGTKKLWSEGYGDGCEIDCPDCQSPKILNINPAETISEYPESMEDGSFFMD